MATGVPIKSVVEMTWPEVQEASRQTNTILIPVGQVAQHGRHLPMNTDVIQAEEACRRTVARLQEFGIRILQGPTIPLGHSPTHSRFPGYVSLLPDTMTRLIYDVVSSLAQQGFGRFVVFNVGGGNWGAVENAAFQIHNNLKAEIYLLGWFEMAPIWAPFLATHRPSSNESDGHAGELETSCVLAVAPQLVNERDAVRFHPSMVAELERLPFVNMNINERMRAIGCWDVSTLTPTGIWGDATAATAEKGEKIFDAVADALSAHIRKYVLKV